ncbi:MAG: hypothetical protein E7618_02380 [Ruminococcaceae bacterium]|nr:hypothetical protein [Oscillospiraceae bacterium]
MDYLTKIAAELGTSRSSVYRAMKYMQPMSADTRKRIIDYVKTNYPDKLAQLNASHNGIARKQIAIIMPYKPKYFWEEAVRGMEAAKIAFKTSPVELKYIFYSGALSEEELISILGSLEVNTADALCIVPVNSEKVAERINEIAGKIPVAIFNEMCDGASTFLNVISDGYAEGQAIGAMVKNHCPPDSHVVMISTETYRSNIFADRIRGFYEVFHATSPSPIIDEINIEYNDRYNYHTILPAMMARKVFECFEAIERKGGRVHATYVTNGALLPLFIALRKLDRRDVFVFGHELNAKALEFFKTDMQGGYVRQDIYMQGYAVVEGLIQKLFFDRRIYPDIYHTQFDIGCYINPTNPS